MPEHNYLLKNECLFPNFSKIRWIRATSYNSPVCATS